MIGIETTEYRIESDTIGRKIEVCIRIRIDITFTAWYHNDHGTNKKEEVFRHLRIATKIGKKYFIQGVLNREIE